MDSVIYRLFCHEFQSNERKEPQNKRALDQFSKTYQMIWDCLKELDESKQNKVLDALRKFTEEAAGDRAEYFAEGFCTGAKLMMEVLTTI